MNTGRFRHWLLLATGRLQPINEGQRRYTVITQGVLTGLVSRVIGVVVSFISVPLTIRYLGAERYGIWMTISTMLLWLNIADFGMGSSLTNALAEAYAKDDRNLAQTYVATVLSMLVTVAFLIGGIIAVCWQWIDWVALFNIRSDQAKVEVSPAVAIALLIFLINFPASLISKIFTACQENSLANNWATVGNVSSLIGLIIVTKFQGGLVWLAAGFSGSIMLVTLISAIWLFGWHKPWLKPKLSSIRLNALKQLGTTGGMFFVISIAWILIFQSHNLIIAYHLGAKAVTPYSITWRLFTFATLIQTLIFPSLWPAYTEAFARGDGKWIKKTFWVNMRISLISTLLITLPLLIFGQFIIQKWAGNEAVPTFSLLIWMSIWSVLLSVMNVIACVLNGSGRIQSQMFYAMFTAISTILSAVYLVKSWGVDGVIAATIMSYLIFALIPSMFEAILVIKRINNVQNG